MPENLPSLRQTLYTIIVINIPPSLVKQDKALEIQRSIIQPK